MFDSNAKVYGGRWRAVRQLGRGGQGVVYEAHDAYGVPTRDALTRQIQAAFRTMQNEIHMVSPDASKFDDFAEMIRTVARSVTLPRGALKELLPLDDAVNAGIAIERMTTELGTLKSLEHPALISVIDARLSERWFVTEFFGNGTLATHLDVYRGRALATLRAFRPIVDAVATLHAKGIVHRDIKPANVFVADDGRLVLGDCGLAIRLDNLDRVTDTYENVGSRDWMPGWAQGMRLQDVKPTFDVFSLGKLLWAMVSGKPHLRLWYFDRPEFDLRRMFPQDAEMHRLTRILAACVREHEDQLSAATASDLRTLVDDAIVALESGAQIPSQGRPMRCRFCGLGDYKLQHHMTRDGYADPKDTLYHYRCEECGHVDAFLWRKNQQPGAWID